MATKTANLTFRPAVRDTLARYANKEQSSESGLVADLLKTLWKKEGIEIRENTEAEARELDAKKANRPALGLTLAGSR